MITVLAFALLTAATPTIEYAAWIKNDVVHVRFARIDQIYGPLKFYIAPTGTPEASGCATCPEGVPAQYVVDPSSVYQSWPQGGRYMEAAFPIGLVGGSKSFNFTAVSCVSSGEYLLGSGSVPTAVTNLRAGR